MRPFRWPVWVCITSQILVLVVLYKYYFMIFLWKFSICFLDTYCSIYFTNYLLYLCTFILYSSQWSVDDKKLVTSCTCVYEKLYLCRHLNIAGSLQQIVVYFMGMIHTHLSSDNSKTFYQAAWRKLPSDKGPEVAQILKVWGNKLGSLAGLKPSFSFKIFIQKFSFHFHLPSSLHTGIFIYLAV